MARVGTALQIEDGVRCMIRQIGIPKPVCHTANMQIFVQGLHEAMEISESLTS